jgi:endonuclease/exonuclease/phosphatase family metal-dependent hydrolase
MIFAILAVLLLSQLVPLAFVEQSSASPIQRGENQSKEAHGADNSMLLESGQAAKIRTPVANRELRVISYNIRWRSGEDLKKLIKLFREDEEIGNAGVIALQEVDRQKQRSGKTNTAKQIADELGLYYAWAAPPSGKPNAEEETGVAILSAYPLTNVCRIVLPHEGPDQRRRVALGASVKIGAVEVRVYSAHAETRISMDKKLDQMNALLTDLKQHADGKPAIIMGDLNTWQSDAARKTIKLFSDAGFTTPFGSQTTFSRKVLFIPIDFRLDWIWFRGLEPVNYGIDRKIGLSDHWPLWTTIKLGSEKR